MYVKNMTAILIHLIIAIVVLGLIWYLLTLLPLPAPAKTIITVLLVLVAILWLLRVGGLWAW